MLDKEIQEQAEKLYPKYPNGGNINLDQHVNCKRKAFVKGAQWMQERENNNAINLLEAEVIEALECCQQYFAKHKIKSAVVVMVDKALEKTKHEDNRTKDKRTKA